LQEKRPEEPEIIIAFQVSRMWSLEI